MNTYAKYCPNVFVAKCTEQHQKGDVIPVTTKYGKENDSIVFNLLLTKDGFYYYSIIRADGFNMQEWAKKRAERALSWAGSAEKKSNHFYEKSNQHADFLSLAEPIKVGHHSEKRHRKIIDDAWNNMGKSVEFAEKADDHRDKAKYWESRANDINLSMPESIEYWEYKFEEAKMKHEGMKNGTVKRDHSMSLQYANKAVKEAGKNLEIAKRLWS